MAPSVNAKPELQAWHRAANLADPWQKAAGSFLFLRIWGFEGLLPSPQPLHREHCGESQGLRFPLQSSQAFKGKGSQPAVETPLDVVNWPHWKISRKSTQPTWCQELGMFPEAQAFAVPFLGWPRLSQYGCHNVGDLQGPLFPSPPSIMPKLWFKVLETIQCRAPGR